MAEQIAEHSLVFLRDLIWFRRLGGKIGFEFGSAKWRLINTGAYKREQVVPKEALELYRYDVLTI
jgi:hypothetical protein